jgi:predicted ribonuclease YlaK
VQFVRGRLPVVLPPFIGRQDELRTLHGLLEHERLVTIAGPGGGGKTRLAIAAAG